jgi:hypothetical protein
VPVTPWSCWSQVRQESISMIATMRRAAYSGRAKIAAIGSMY